MSAVEVFALYRQVGEAAFVEMITQSGISEARMLEMAAQVTNLPTMRAAEVLSMHDAVAQRGRQVVKNELLNSGIVDEDIELAFRAAGV